MFNTKSVYVYPQNNYFHHRRDNSRHDQKRLGTNHNPCVAFIITDRLTVTRHDPRLVMLNLIMITIIIICVQIIHVWYIIWYIIHIIPSMNVFLCILPVQFAYLLHLHLLFITSLFHWSSKISRSSMLIPNIEKCRNLQTMAYSIP